MIDIRRLGERTSVTEQVLEEILRYIRGRGLRPGDRLPTEDELCKNLGVSRTVVREAMNSLKGRGGLVVSVPGRGTFVGMPDAGAVARTISSLLDLQECTLKDVYDIRTSLEVSFAGVAAEKATEEDIERIHEALEDLVAHADDLDKALEADRQFHVAIAAASSNRLAAVLVEAMILLTVETRIRTFRFDNYFAREHKEVHDAILARESGKARSAMARHFDAVREMLGEGFKQDAGQ